MTNWSTIDNVAEFGGANPGTNWPNEVSRGNFATLGLAKASATADARVTYFFYCRQAMDLSNFGKGIFQPGDAVFFSGTAWWGSAPQCSGYLKERLPRNMVWVGDATSPPSQNALDDLYASPYTHLMFCFLHLDAELDLRYNDDSIVNSPEPKRSEIAGYWPKLTALKCGPTPKTLLMSVSGWIKPEKWSVGTWANIQGKEIQAAGILGDFVEQRGFDGVDLNFEGAWGYRNDPVWLGVMAKLAITLRDRLPDKIVTLAPIGDNVLTNKVNDSTPVDATTQLDAINAELRAQGRNQTWLDILSWVNVQFYMYNDVQASPDAVGDPNVLYDNLVGLGLPVDRLLVGFPLNGADATTPTASDFNPGELTTASDLVKAWVQAHPGFAGAFVWNYKATALPPDLNWGAKMASALGLPALA